MKEVWILGIHMTDRANEASEVQAILTKYGCTIKTRLGLHEVHDDYCAPNGIILLELTGQPEEFHKLENELLKISGLDVKKMVFRD